MNSNYYKRGSWNVHCQRCGFKRKAEDIRKEWTGFLVCADTCWEPRHPQDFLRGVADHQSVLYTNKDPVVFVDVTYGPLNSVVNEAPIDHAIYNDPINHRVRPYQRNFSMPVRLSSYADDYADNYA